MKTSTFKILRYFVISVAVSMGLLGSALAQTQNQKASNQSCQPFSIPMAPVPCGPGYTGSKFPMKTMQCPSGVVTIGSTFDTSNCKPVGVTTDPNATNCSITPTAVGCIAPPTGMGCVTGRHWTTEGDGIAHCVNDDPNCPWGTSLTHDNMGNPSCVPNTCPSNQQLQSDGISCACPPSLSVWSGGVCSAPVVCPISQTVASACPSGYTGNQVSTTSFSGNACTPSTTVDTSGCIPPPTCPAPSVTTGACPSGYVGNIVTTTSYSVQNGSCVANPSVDLSGCAPKQPQYCPDGSIMPASGVCSVACPYPNTMQTVPQSPVPVCLHPFVQVILNSMDPQGAYQFFSLNDYSYIAVDDVQENGAGVEMVPSLNGLKSLLDPAGNNPKPVLLVFYNGGGACSIHVYSLSAGDPFLDIQGGQFGVAPTDGTLIYGYSANGCS